MEITVQQGDIRGAAADAIIVNLFADVSSPAGGTGAVNTTLGGAIQEVIDSGDISGKLGETLVLYPRGAIPAKRVIIVGLGPRDGFSLESVREAAGSAIKKARDMGANTVATIVHGAGIGGLTVEGAAQAVVEASLMALYEYDAPRSLNRSNPKIIDELILIEFDAMKIGDIEAGAAVGEAMAEGVALARTLVNQPSNVATPTAIANAATKMCGQVGISGKAYDEKWMREQKMEVLLAVTQGSREQAKFVVMEHNPSSATNRQPVVLVGKGVAFDTGGYSIKSSDGMVGMKGDMGGAAAVIGAMNVIGRLNLPVYVIGIVPTVENMVSSTAYKPNDVFVAKNKVSVEIISTDAEGRLILADALCYADTLDPMVVIDLATLTGGKMVALGNRTQALFTDDDALHTALIAAGETSGEPLWRMPLDKSYDRQLKSDVADIKNTGGRMASAVTAARFLAHFVGDWPWAHIDIAGADMHSGKAEETDRSYLTKGGTGVMVRSLVEYVRGL
ncbi:MAG: leucyl aminopeptidase [Cellvibrionaceae bacterium]|jgi:leucyl aminopeptidase